MLYRELVGFYEKLGNTSKRLEKTYLLSQLIKKTDEAELPILILLAQGKIFPEGEDKKVGVASQLIIKAISRATGISIEEIEKEWKVQGDLGNVAESLISRKKQSSLFHRNFTISELFKSLQNLASLEGGGSVEKKIALISELLVNSTPQEAKYIIRTIANNMRLGMGAGSMRDALAWAYFSEDMGISYDDQLKSINLSGKRKDYNALLDKIQRAYDLTNDFATVALALKKDKTNGLESLSLAPGKPVKVMLFQKAESIEEAFSVVGKPAAFEFKYDGFRVVIHKSQGEIRIFTRRLEDVTVQFPEAVRYLKEGVKAESCILDGEAVGIDKGTGKYLPFQAISQRIKRKHEIDKLAKLYPVEITLFDILYLDGKSLLNSPFKERRELLEKIISADNGKLSLAKQLITDDKDKAREFYEKAISLGQEGLMAKNIEGRYMPGSRVGYGVKIKPVMEPLDLVIIGAEYGEGKRSGWLTSYYLACLDGSQLKEIGKVSTGLKELETEGISFKEMTSLLEPLIEKSTGKYVKVKPEIVIEVAYEEIQKSPSYSSGYALRFPRFLRLRTDEKTIHEINTMDDVRKLYRMQRGK